jgi:hypothetical protein
VFTVDLHIPAHLHDVLDLAPAIKSAVPSDWLSAEQVDRRNKYGAAKTEKLLPYLGDHVRVSHHIAYLQMLRKLGVEITRVYHDECWNFHQERWLEPFIREIFKKRQESTDETVRECMKLELNSLYGKFLQNSMGHVNTLMYTCLGNFSEAAFEDRCVNFHVINDGSAPDLPFLATVDRAKGAADVERSHRPTGFFVLEMSKICMYELHSDVVKRFYSDRAKLLYMDTDSLMYELQTEDPSTDMLDMNSSLGGQFDITAHELSDQHKKTLGSLKYEGARSKGDIKAYAEKHPELTQEALRVNRVQPEIISEYLGTTKSRQASLSTHSQVSNDTLTNTDTPNHAPNV